MREVDPERSVRRRAEHLVGDGTRSSTLLPDRAEAVQHHDDRDERVDVVRQEHVGGAGDGGAGRRDVQVVRQRGADGCDTRREKCPAPTDHERLERLVVHGRDTSRENEELIRENRDDQVRPDHASHAVGKDVERRTDHEVHQRHLDREAHDQLVAVKTPRALEDREDEREEQIDLHAHRQEVQVVHGIAGDEVVADALGCGHHRMLIGDNTFQGLHAADAVSPVHPVEQCPCHEGQPDELEATAPEADRLQAAVAVLIGQHEAGQCEEAISGVAKEDLDGACGDARRGGDADHDVIEDHASERHEPDQIDLIQMLVAPRLLGQRRFLGQYRGLGRHRGLGQRRRVRFAAFRSALGFWQPRRRLLAYDCSPSVNPGPTDHESP